jgi:hypothetical protein
MIWNEVDFTLINKEIGRAGRQSFNYDFRPFRFQIPEGTVEWGLSEYNALTIDIPDPEFHAWFHSLEDYIGKPQPFSSVLKEHLRIKLDASSQVFDDGRRIDESVRGTGAYKNCRVKCIIEVSGMYYFKETYGLTCKIYQMIYAKPLEPEPEPEPGVCLFSA